METFDRRDNRCEDARPVAVRIGDDHSAVSVSEPRCPRAKRQRIDVRPHATSSPTAVTPLARESGHAEALSAKRLVEPVCLVVWPVAYERQLSLGSTAHRIAPFGQLGHHRRRPSPQTIAHSAHQSTRRVSVPAANSAFRFNRHRPRPLSASLIRVRSRQHPLSRLTGGSTGERRCGNFDDLGQGHLGELRRRGTQCLHAVAICSHQAC